MKEPKERIQKIVEKVERLTTQMEQITKELADDEKAWYALQNMEQSLRNFMVFTSYLPTHLK